MDITLAETPEQLSAKRAAVFEAAAEEIAKIDRVKVAELVRGRIGVAFDAIKSAMGKSERDFLKEDPRKISLLTESFVEAFKVKVRNPAHLFCEVRRRVGDEDKVYARKATERSDIEQFLRGVAKRLCNGHAGVWI